jgi:hypothetical protein
MPVAAEVCRKENCLGLRVGAISEVATITLADLKVVTITKPISIAVRYGSVSVSAGAKLPFISRAGDKTRVRYYDGADYDIPMSATDLK